MRKRVLESGTLIQAKRAVKYFSNAYLNVDFSLDRARAILDGSWPQAAMILQESLKKATAYHEKDE